MLTLAFLGTICVMVTYMGYNDYCLTQKKRIDLELKRLELIDKQMKDPKNAFPEMLRGDGTVFAGDWSKPETVVKLVKELPPAPPEDAQRREGWGHYD